VYGYFTHFIKEMRQKFGQVQNARPTLHAATITYSLMFPKPIGELHAWLLPILAIVDTLSYCTLALSNSFCNCSNNCSITPSIFKRCHGYDSYRWYLASVKDPIKATPSLPKNLAYTSYMGWHWRNFVPYLCQLIFAAILIVGKTLRIV